MANFKAAARSLLATPSLTLVIVATLAIAIGANTAIFSVVNGVLLRSLGYDDDDGLVVVWAAHDNNRADTFRLSPADYRDLRENVDAFDGNVALYRSIGSTLTGLDQPVRVGSLTVTPRLFPVLKAKPAVGQFFDDADEKPGGGKKLIMTHASWTRRFGADPSIVGDTVSLDGEPYTVVGVTEKGFQFPPGDDKIEMYFPMKLSDQVLLDRNHRMFDSIARIGEETPLTAANAELMTLAARLEGEFPDTNAGWTLVGRSLREELTGNLAATLWVLAGAVFLVLLTACANVANLLVARSTAAAREFAVRSALGATRQDLVRRSLAESFLLGIAGGTGGLLLAMWGARFLQGVMPAEILRGVTVSLDATVLLFALALTLGATALFGLLPALRSMSGNVVDLVKPTHASSAGSGGGRRIRELMVVVEVALAIVLLVGAGLMAKSFSKLGEVDPGFRQEGVVSIAIQLPGTTYARDTWRPFFEQLVERTRELPGVQAAGAISDLPMSSIGLDFELEFKVPGLDAISPTARPSAEFRLAVPGYFETMDMALVRGRAFNSLDATSERSVAIVNETLAARYFSDLDPIGRAIDVDMLGEVEIVGVVNDVKHDGLLSKYESEVYVPYGRISTREMHVVVLSELEPEAISNAVGSVLNDMDPAIVPTEVSVVSELLWESVAQPRFNTALLIGLALCAGVLAVVGTYGIVAFMVSQRTTEIGVRMALGADASATVSMIVRQALGIVLAGTVLGIVGALGGSRFLSGLLFDVAPTDPLTYTVVLAGATIVGLLAAWTPARRAARVDPVSALRGD